MKSSVRAGKAAKNLYGVKGWLIVLVVMLIIKFIITLVQGAAIGVDVFLALASLAMSTLILVFLFRKKIVFRFLFVILCGLDLGFGLSHIFEMNPLYEIQWYTEYTVFFVISLVYISFFMIYIFNSKRVENTYPESSKALGGASSAFLIFIISFLVVNIFSLIETAFYTSSNIIRYSQMPFISALMAYIIPILLGALIILRIIKRKVSFRPAFIAMMLVNIALLFMVFSYFGANAAYPYELYSDSLPMNVSVQALYSLGSLVAWTIVLYKSKGIKKDLGIS